MNQKQIWVYDLDSAPPVWWQFVPHPCPQPQDVPLVPPGWDVAYPKGRTRQGGRVLVAQTTAPQDRGGPSLRDPVPSNVPVPAPSHPGAAAAPRPPTRRSVGAGPGDSRLRALPPCNISGSLSSPCGAGGWPGRITTPNIPHKSAFQSQQLIYGSRPRDRGVSSPADPDVGQLWPSRPQALRDSDILTDVPRPYGGTGHTHPSRAGQDFGGPHPLFGFRSPLGVRASTAACPQPGPAAPFASRSEDVITRLSSHSDVGKLN